MTQFDLYRSAENPLPSESGAAQPALSDTPSALIAIPALARISERRYADRRGGPVGGLGSAAEAKARNKKRINTLTDNFDNPVFDQMELRDIAKRQAECVTGARCYIKGCHECDRAVGD